MRKQKIASTLLCRLSCNCRLSLCFKLPFDQHNALGDVETGNWTRASSFCAMIFPCASSSSHELLQFTARRMCTRLSGVPLLEATVLWLREEINDYVIDEVVEAKLIKSPDCPR